MQLIIDEPGIYLSVDNDRLALQKGETVKYLVPSRITAIHILKPCSLSSPALAWAATYEIPVLIYNNSGKIMARSWQPQFGSHAAIRIRQLQFCSSPEALFWIQQLLIKRAQQQERILRQLPAHLQHQQVLERVSALRERLIQDTAINQHWLRSLEAGISRWYWAGIAFALKQYIQVQPRRVHPARDRFNALLNYLYGTLYALVEGCLVAAGLDPHIAIMHRMEYDTPSLAFDVIEPFRHWADGFVISLVLNNTLQQDYWEEKSGRLWLSSKGKKQVLTQWFEYLNQKTPSPRKLIKRKDQVQQLCTSLAARLLKEYKAEEKNRKP
jgi:CRISPR-associated protein Cas1